ncbi:hypothetical protein ACOMHN_023758 [Nucella lapillus]
MASAKHPPHHHGTKTLPDRRRGGGSSSSPRTPMTFTPFARVKVAAILVAILAILSTGSPSTQAHAQDVEFLPPPLPRELSAEQPAGSFLLLLRDAVVPVEKGSSLDDIENHLSRDGATWRKYERRLSPLRRLPASSLRKRGGGWRKIPIQTRFAPFGSKLILPKGRQGNGRSGPSLLRYGRSA